MNFEKRQMPGSPVTLDGNTLRGYAIIYNSDSLDLGGFVERFLPGSITDTIKSGLMEAWTYHDPTKPLGSQAARSLRLEEDNKGLAYEVDLPDTSYARDLKAMMSDGRNDVGGTSFGFRPVAPGGERWLRDGSGRLIREIIKADLDHISPVITPAYPATSAMLRSLNDGQQNELEDLYGIDIAQLGKIFLAHKRGLELTESEQEVARDVIQRLRGLVRTPRLHAAADRATRILL